MQTPVIYEFDGILIRLEKAPEALISLIKENSCLSPVLDRQCSECISISFVDDFSRDGLQSILNTNNPPTAETGIRLKGETIYRLYRDDRSGIWHIYDSYGAVHMDIEHSRIESFYCDTIADRDMQPFMLLFISPLIGMLRNFGYQYLHAAACRVLGRNILFAGLSGRGKSTASLALSIKGHQVMTDESVLLRKEDGQIHAVALMNWIKVSREVLKRFWPSFDKGQPIYTSEVAVKISDVNAQALTVFDTIDCVCILSQTGLEATEIRAIDAMDVIPEMLPASIYAIDETSMASSFLFLTDFIKGMPCYQVFFGTDMERFAGEVEKLAASLEPRLC